MEPNNLIGRGRYSAVYRVMLNNAWVAIKLVPYGELDEEERKVFMREIEFVDSQIKHRDQRSDAYIVTY